MLSQTLLTLLASESAASPSEYSALPDLLLTLLASESAASPSEYSALPDLADPSGK